MFGVVAEVSEPDVVLVAQNPANDAGLVVVAGVPLALAAGFRCPANSAPIALRGEYRVPLARKKVVFPVPLLSGYLLAVRGFVDGAASGYCLTVRGPVGCFVDGSCLTVQSQIGGVVARPRPTTRSTAAAMFVVV